MRIGEFNDMLDDTFSCPEHVAVLGVGPAGIGKTQAPMEIARRRGWKVEALCMPLINPTFLTGYPFRGADGTADHAPFGALSRAMNATEPTILLFDDLGGASGETAKAALRVFQFREVCGKELPDCVRIVAFTNDVGHGMEIQGLVEPLKDRFISIVNVEPHIDDTVTYGLSRGWSPAILGYLRNCNEALHDLTPLKSMQRAGATPRGWEGMAKLERLGLLDKPYGNELAWGAVGKGRATQYLAFRALIAELPDINQIKIDPENAPIPVNPSARLLVAMSIASQMDANSFGQFLKYLNRMDQVFRAYGIRDAIKAETAKQKAGTLAKGFKQLHHNRDFIAWSTSKDGQEIMSASADR